MVMRLKEKQEYEAWLKEKAAIKRLSPAGRESESAKKKRIDKLLKIGNETKFFTYYFSHLIDCDFAYFHKRDCKEIAENNDIFALLEYPREHAKSIIYDVFLPMLLKAKNELGGMMVASANEKKANKLLADIQAELMFNRRYIADFGEQYNQGKWQDGQFTTIDGVGFWAFGRGQSPRGTREGEKRPKYGVFDDIDDKVLVRNEDRVDDEIASMLKTDTWLTPDKARDAKLVDEIIITGKKKELAALEPKKLVAKINHEHNSKSMKKVIAKLNGFGLHISDDASEDQVVAALDNFDVNEDKPSVKLVDQLIVIGKKNRYCNGRRKGQ